MLENVSTIRFENINMSKINQSCKNVQTVPTSRCYFFWPVLIFGKSTRKTANFWEKHAKNCKFLGKAREKLLIFGANFFGGEIGWC